MPLSSPSTGDRCPPADVIGHLLIIKLDEYIEDFPTDNGPKPVVRLDVVDLDNGGYYYQSAIWFGRAMVPGLKRDIGRIVLARMGQGVAKGTQSPPFLLVDAMTDPAAVQRANAWLTANPWFENGTPQTHSPTQGVNVPAVATSNPASVYPATVQNMTNAVPQQPRIDQLSADQIMALLRAQGLVP